MSRQIFTGSLRILDHDSTIEITLPEKLADELVRLGQLLTAPESRSKISIHISNIKNTPSHKQIEDIIIASMGQKNPIKEKSHNELNGEKTLETTGKSIEAIQLISSELIEHDGKDWHHKPIKNGSFREKFAAYLTPGNALQTPNNPTPKEYMKELEKQYRAYANRATVPGGEIMWVP